MVSIIITAWKEEKTIAKALYSFLDDDYVRSELPFEIIIVAPDEETRNAAKYAALEIGIGSKLKLLKDEALGKPSALNLALEKSNGDVLIFSDGDVFVEKNAVSELLKILKDESVGIVSGRPVSIDPKTNFMGYMGHLLSDAAHHKRSKVLINHFEGEDKSISQKNDFFPVSGYLYALRRSDEIKFPSDCLVDDAYISYLVFNKGLKVAYQPRAVVYVKYPKTLSDYFRQKKRSTGGYLQLWEYGIIKPETKSRTFFKELEYFWFPIKYAKNLKELLWSLLIYPLRLSLWIAIIWERKIIKKEFSKTWTRVETTK
ncbi:glycosyltransferase [Candidatus Dojkabacteria bacterium]|uniref:Glycosyltransferase n=1 Tax=Candidatus Dojkabacteria bacterium TaxID=2099670 RepID=A0A3M0YZB5_9BACT|nr:MAG: glycosyltransferase [Candidatus Dojkabacteria bacterium]